MADSTLRLTTAFSIALSSGRPDTHLTVDGEQVARSLHLINKHEVLVLFGRLEYQFKYTPFAGSEVLETLRDEMLMEAGGTPEHVDIVIPSPSPTTRTIGRSAIRLAGALTAESCWEPIRKKKWSPSRSWALQLISSHPPPV